MKTLSDAVGSPGGAAAVPTAAHRSSEGEGRPPCRPGCAPVPDQRRRRAAVPDRPRIGPGLRASRRLPVPAGSNRP